MSHLLRLLVSRIFFFNDTATTEIYTLSLHDALPISPPGHRHPPTSVHAADRVRARDRHAPASAGVRELVRGGDRKSTRLNSSHANISYAVFCLKKKKNISSQPPLHRLLYTTAQSSTL